MEREVAIVGWAQTVHEQAKPGQHLVGMVYETVKAALADAGMTAARIDTVVSAGCDTLDGRSISNVFVVEAMGGFQKEEAKVEEDGAFAASYAVMRLLSGRFGTALVVAYSKGSESSPQTYSGTIADPFYLRPLGVEAITAAALQARAYLARSGATEDDMARVAAKNLAAARANPHAQRRLGESLEEVAASPVLASPIRRLTASPVSDGCCAAVLAVRERAGEARNRPAWIRGVAHCTDGFYPGHRDLAGLPAAREAATRAYRMAGISDPAREIGCFELYESFAHQELMLYEALGLCGKGEGKELARSGATASDGRHPVNCSGGALAADPIMAAGLVRLVEAAAQVTGRAGAMQVDGVRTALAHAQSGLAMQSNIVYVLSGD